MVKSDGVKIREISETSAGITLVIYVLIDGSEILNRDSLLAAIQVQELRKVFHKSYVTSFFSTEWIGYLQDVQLHLCDCRAF